MRGKAIVPAIRFAGFTDAWERRKLAEIAGRTYGGGTPKTNIMEYWDGYIPWIQSSNLMEHELFNVDIQKHITDDGLNKSAAQLVPPNSVAVVSHVGVGKLVLMPLSYTTSQDFISLSELKADPIFTCYSVYKRLQNDLHIVQGSAIKGITKDDLLSKEIMLPSESEQIKIGEYFRHLDHLITLHQCKYSRLCNIKKSMLERMFPKEGASVPEIRFAGFTDAWEQCKLGGLVQFSKGTGYSKADLKEKGTPIILYGRLYTKYETVISDVDTYADSRDGSVYSRGGEVIVPASGETAEDISVASVVEKPGILLGGDLNIITPPADLDPAFLAISISNGKPHDDMAKMAQGKSVVHLHNADLEKIDFMYPCYTEQMQISTYFKNLDHLITLHQRELEQLQNIKKSCLEKMFV